MTITEPLADTTEPGTTNGNGNGNGNTPLTPADITRMFGDGYRGVEILPDGRVREGDAGNGGIDEDVTRTLKTQRTWY